MNLTNNYHPINSKNYRVTHYNPYLLSNKENIGNNLTPIYNISDSNTSSLKKDTPSYEFVKKSLNLDISEYINNSNNPKAEIEKNIQRNSSFTSHTINNKILELKDKNKKTLILDLDETLVHSAFTPFSRKSDLMLTINFDGEDRLLYVLKRPYVDEFLCELANLYEIIIFTASIPEYANPLLDQLDKYKVIKYRLFREHCTFDNGIYIKDLKIFDRKINNMIIIDNNPLSYDHNIENGIPILSWYEDSNDNELMKLLPILKYMANNDIIDVRDIIKNIVDRNRNEVNFLAINKFIDDSKISKDQSLTTKEDSRKVNKSEEPKTKINNNINKNNNYFTNNIYSSLNHPYSGYNNEYLKNDILNRRYNIYKNNNTIEKPNINIDKKDPEGTRISIFSPEEYNTLYNNKSYHFPFNRNMYTINSIEERKTNNYNKTIEPPMEKNNFFDNKQSNNNALSNKSELERTLTPKPNYRKNMNHMNKTKNQNNIKVNRHHSLVEMTKKALHLVDTKEEDKNDEFDSVSKALNKYNNKNNYLQGQNQIMHNNYVNENKYINNYRSVKNIEIKNPQLKYFCNYIEESKNIEKYSNNKNNIKNQLNLLKQINSFKKDADKMVSNNNSFNLSQKEKLMKRMNDRKITNYFGTNNNILGNNYLLKGKNYKNDYMNIYSQMNKDNYINKLKNSKEQNVSYSNKKPLNTTINNYNNMKLYNDKKYDLLNDYKTKAFGNIINSNKKVSYINGNINNLVNLKQSYLKKNEQFYDFNNLIRSSSFIQSKNVINKIIDNFSLYKNSNKENESNNNNLNYKYNLINDVENKNMMQFNNTFYGKIKTKNF